MVGTIGVLMRTWYVVQDLPDGNYHELKKKGVQPKNNLGREMIVALR